MRPLRKFLALRSDRRRLLAKASFLLIVIRMGLGRVPFTTLRRIVIGRPCQPSPAAADDPRFPEEVVWAVTALSERAPRWTTCLTRALTVQAMLARRGYPSRLHFGVVRGSRGELEAHAWVEREGRILIGGSAPGLAQFAPLAAFDVEAMTLPVAALQGER